MKSEVGIALGAGVTVGSRGIDALAEGVTVGARGIGAFTRGAGFGGFTTLFLVVITGAVGDDGRFSRGW